MVATRKQGSTPQDWMSVGAAGRALRKTRLAVLTMIVRGELIGEDRGGYTFVRRSSVDAMIAAREESAGAA